MSLLVTGCAKSGTHFLAHELRSRGVRCGHEVAYTRKYHGPVKTAEVSWLAAPYTPVDAYTVHLVRHPLKVIRSLAREDAAWSPQASPSHPHNYFLYAAEHLPDVMLARSALEAAAIYWMGWNELVIAHERLRIEDITRSDLDRLASIVEGSTAPMGGPVEVGPEAPELGWEDIGVPGLREMAESYGY